MCVRWVAFSGRSLLLNEWRFVADSVCKDFPRESRSGLNFLRVPMRRANLAGGPVDGVVIALPVLDVQAIPGTDCVFANGLVVRACRAGHDMSRTGEPYLKPANRHAAHGLPDANGNRGPSTSSCCSPLIKGR
jgi:hypothetical protein